MVALVLILAQRVLLPKYKHQYKYRGLAQFLQTSIKLLNCGRVAPVCSDGEISEGPAENHLSRSDCFFLLFCLFEDLSLFLLKEKDQGAGCEQSFKF